MKTESKNSPFAKILDAWPEARLREVMERAGPGDVKRALGREQPLPEDLAALLSPAAAPFLEDMARRPTASRGAYSDGPSGCTSPFICPISAPPTAPTAVSRCTPEAREKGAP